MNPDMNPDQNPHDFNTCFDRACQHRSHFLSMPDPCPHITRMQLISARLNNECNELDAYTDHLTNCKGN